MPRFRDPERTIGNLSPDGERVAGEAPVMVEYVEVIPSFTMPSVEEAILNHSRALDAAERRPRIASASFRSPRSLSRFA
jgi:hypothetical protein